MIETNKLISGEEEEAEKIIYLYKLPTLNRSTNIVHPILGKGAVGGAM